MTSPFLKSNPWCRPPDPSANTYEFKSILLVDDDRQLAESLQWFLLDAKFFVDMAYDGDEAIVKVRTNSYDAIVCDILMPRLHGDDFYRQATELSPRLRGRFIFTTGYANDPQISGFIRANRVKCLVKPFPVENLIACLRGVVSPGRGKN